MTSTQIALSIFEQIKLKLSKNYFDSEAKINFCKAGNINSRYIYDISLTVEAGSFIDDTDNDNDYNVRTYYDITTDCTICIADWKGKEIESNFKSSLPNNTWSSLREESRYFILIVSETFRLSKNISFELIKLS